MCAASFDHFVGAGKQHRRHVEAERLSGLEIDDQLELGWLLDWQVCGLSTPENLVDISRGAEIKMRETHPVGHQTAGLDELSSDVNGGQPIACRQFDDHSGIGLEQAVKSDKESVDVPSDCRLERAVHV